MKRITIIARAIVYNPKTKSILLVRKSGASFWHAPGGGLNENENIKECAIREVFEETGLNIRIRRLLYAQELHDSGSRINFEFFWLAGLSGQQKLNKNHVDPDTDDGIVESGWFNKIQLQDITVYPKRLKESFWDNIGIISDSEDPFVGVFA